MDRESYNYGKGPRELTGAVDLIDHFKLIHHHEFFCKKPIPDTLSKAHYLRNVVGATDISKGEGMQLNELIQKLPCSTVKKAAIQAFDMNILSEAFNFKGPIVIPRGGIGVSSIPVNSDFDVKEIKKSKRPRDLTVVKDRGSKKSRHNPKHPGSDMRKDTQLSGGHHGSKTDPRKPQEKKRRQGGDEAYNSSRRQKKM